MPKAESGSAGVKGGAAAYAQASGAEPEGSMEPAAHCVQPAQSTERVQCVSLTAVSGRRVSVASVEGVGCW